MLGYISTFIHTNISIQFAQNMLHKFNISGYKFLLSKDLLDTYPSSLFSSMVSSIDICDKDDDGYIFIQRCPIFGQLIHESIVSHFNFNKFYQNIGKLYDGDAFIDELLFYNLDPVFSCSCNILLCKIENGFSSDIRNPRYGIHTHTILIFPCNENLWFIPNININYKTSINGNSTPMLVLETYGTISSKLGNSNNLFLDINKINNCWFSIKVNDIPINQFFTKKINSEKKCDISFTLQKCSSFLDSYNIPH